tara:strand:- start:158 stop:376 length:219 start_codon:yes stop_codon:yes gene_type:complete
MCASKAQSAPKSAALSGAPARHIARQSAPSAVATAAVATAAAVAVAAAADAEEVAAATVGPWLGAAGSWLLL